MPQPTRSAGPCLWLSLLLLLAGTIQANTEKAIFLGPEAVDLPSTHPGLADLRVDTLTPANWALRTHLEARFQDAAENPAGKASWFILDDLSPGQRYELRICWAATQPTEFRLNTYELEKVLGTPELISSLSNYSWGRQSASDGPAEDGAEAQPDTSAGILQEERRASVLLLEILTAADYYTMNQTLMDTVPPVFVDIILDPYILNVLPRSLVPTVGYIVVVAVLSWFLARSVSTWIGKFARAPDRAKKDQ